MLMPTVQWGYVHAVTYKTVIKSLLIATFYTHNPLDLWDPSTDILVNVSFSIFLWWKQTHYVFFIQSNVKCLSNVCMIKRF